MLRRRLALGFLLLQVLLVARLRVSPDRYFGWAPFHEHATYRIEVQARGRTLTPDEVELRYRGPSSFGIATGERWETNSMEHVFRIVDAYESTYGREDAAAVVIRWKRNGGAAEEWQWPRP